MINANAKYNNTTEQYLEYYSGFYDIYSYKSSSDAAYVFYFYLIDEGTPSVHIRADESVTENVAQWSGNGRLQDGRCDGRYRNCRRFSQCK